MPAPHTRRAIGCSSREMLRDHMGAAPATVDAVFPDYTAEGLGGQELGLISV